MRLKIVFQPSDEGGFSVYVPALPGCISEGDSLDEARSNIREAIECHLDAPTPPILPDEAQVQEVEV